MRARMSPRIRATLTTARRDVPRRICAHRKASKYAASLEDAIEVARNVRSLVEVDAEGQIKALQRAKTREERYRLHCDAYKARDQMPPDATIRAGYTALGRAIITEPTAMERNAMTGMPLDVLCIRNDDGAFDSYVAALARKLGDCLRRKTETIGRKTPWMPAPSIVPQSMCSSQSIVRTTGSHRRQPISWTRSADKAADCSRYAATCGS